MINIGYIFAFLTALIKSIQLVYVKINSTDSGEYVTSWSVRFFTMITLLPTIIYKVTTTNIEISPNLLLTALLISGIINAIAIILKTKAYKHSDLSLIAPIFSLSPAFTGISAFIILGQKPSLLGSIGIFLIIFGAYFLKLSNKTKEILEPIKAIFNEKGVRLVFIVILMYSISSNFNKIGVSSASPILWVFLVAMFNSILLLPLMIYKTPDWKKELNKNSKNLIIVGILTSIYLTFQMMAIEKILLAYVSAIKRTEIIISIIFGYFIFNETDNFKNRLIGGSIMLTGGIIITIF